MLDANDNCGMGPADSLSQGLPLEVLAAAGIARGAEPVPIRPDAWQAFFEALPEPVAVLDAGGIIVALNAAWRQLVGTAAGASGGPGTSYVMECQADDAMLGPEVPRAIAGVRTVLEGVRDSFLFEYPCQIGSADRWFLMRVLRSTVGEPPFIIVSHEDISVRRQAQMACRHTQERFEQMLAAADVGVWEWDLATNGVYYAPHFKRLLGYGPEEFGEGLEALQSHLHPDDRKATFTTLFHHLEGQGRCRCECRLRTHDGQYRRFHLQASAVRDASGTPIRIAGSLHPQAAEEAEAPQWDQLLRERDRQVRHQQKLLAMGDVAGNMAHEFNNLLQAIQGFVRLALEGLDPQETRAEDLLLALQASDRAAAFSRQLLSFCRRDEERRGPVDLNALVRDLAQWLRPLLGEAITLEAVLEPDLENIVADSAALQQALMNLCINARDAMPSGGRLRLETKRWEPTEELLATCAGYAGGVFARLAVTDSGSGIPPELQDKIFEPFFTTKPAGQGTGLGLPLVRDIVREHQGWLECISEPGTGTTIHMYLPLRPAREARVPSPAPPAVPPLPPSGRTVLVADDEPMIRQLAERVLTSAGYRVVTASDGEEVLKIVHAAPQSIDVVLLDLMMPGRTGEEIFQGLRALRPQLPIVVWSGYCPELGVGEFASRHQLNVFQKPLEPAALLEAIRSASAVAGPRGPLE